MTKLTYRITDGDGFLIEGVMIESVVSVKSVNHLHKSISYSDAKGKVYLDINPQKAQVIGNLPAPEDVYVISAITHENYLGYQYQEKCDPRFPLTVDIEMVPRPKIEELPEDAVDISQELGLAHTPGERPYPGVAQRPTDATSYRFYHGLPPQSDTAAVRQHRRNSDVLRCAGKFDNFRSVAGGPR